MTPQWLEFLSDEVVDMNYTTDYRVSIRGKEVSFIDVDDEDDIEQDLPDAEQLVEFGAEIFYDFDFTDACPTCIVLDCDDTRVTIDVQGFVLDRHAMDAAQHPAMLMVDTISSMGSVEFQHDLWGVDVTVAGSQKGLMLPPGLSFNAVSEKAIQASKTANLPRAYWAWDEILAANKNGFWPSTPATNLLYGLAEALDMLSEEGLENVFARHARLAEATRRAVQAWGLEILCKNPNEYSPVLTAVLMPKKADGDYHDADHFRKNILENYNMSLGTGLAKLQGRVFRVGHLGDINDLTLLGTLSGVEMGLLATGIPHNRGGVQAALDFLARS